MLIYGYRGSYTGKCRQVIIPHVSAVLNLNSGMIICLHGLVCAENCFVRLC